MRTMHLFAGIGGGLLADLILGHTPVVAVEWEPYACRVLRERAADGWFPGMQVWEGDVRLFDPSEYTGIVDCIHAGFPCQDISVAGKQAGLAEGTRSGLYREVLRIAGVVRPRSIFLENVAAIASKGLDQVLKDLAEMGYDSKWLCIRASDVGAPHHRDRWFCLCTNTDSQHGEWRSEPYSATSCSGESWFEPQRVCSNVADTSAEYAQGQQSIVTDAQKRQGQEQRPLGSCGDGIEWWTTEPGLGRVAHGVSNRVGQLKGYGNAQVPLQAATAFRLLCDS